jgi:hypothetical protein
VDDAYEERSPGIDEPEWVYWLDRKEIDVMAGRCLIELGDPVNAEPLLSYAIAGYAPGHAREIALYRTWLAESYARAGVVDAAQGTIDRARRADGVPGPAVLTASVTFQFSDHVIRTPAT